MLIFYFFSIILKINKLFVYFNFSATEIMFLVHRSKRARTYSFDSVLDNSIKPFPLEKNEKFSFQQDNTNNERSRDVFNFSNKSLTSALDESTSTSFEPRMLSSDRSTSMVRIFKIRFYNPSENLQFLFRFCKVKIDVLQSILKSFAFML